MFADDLRDVARSTHRQSRDCVTEVIFSQDGQFLASSDADRYFSFYNTRSPPNNIVIYILILFYVLGVLYYTELHRTMTAAAGLTLANIVLTQSLSQIVFLAPSLTSL